MNLTERIMKDIKAYLTWWMMYAMDCKDEKIYCRKRDEVIDFYDGFDKIGFIIEYIESKILKSSAIKEFLKVNEVPTLYCFSLKEKDHEKPVHWL